MSVYVVSSDMVDSFWELVQPLLIPAVEVAGELAVDDLYPALKDGSKLLWISFDDSLGLYGAAVTSIVQHPLKKVLLLEYLGAVPNTMKLCFEEVRDIFTKWAKHHECDSIEVYGRKGWERVLKDSGYKTTRYVYNLDLKG